MQLSVGFLVLYRSLNSKTAKLVDQNNTDLNNFYLHLEIHGGKESLGDRCNPEC